MTDLSEYSLLLLGQRVVGLDSSYYKHHQYWSFLQTLAEPFGSVTYVCYADDSRRESKAGLTEIDPTKFQLSVNEDWVGSSNPIQRLNGLKESIQTIRQCDGPIVTYVFFPGMFSFLLAPFAFGRGEVNVAYFASEALDAAEGNETAPIYNRIRRTLYSVGQRYVLDTVDIAFVRDARMLEFDGNAEVHESKPISKIEHSDIERNNSVCKGDEITLIFVASFRQVKGHRYLLEAFAKLVEGDERKYRLLLVGDGVTRSKMERYAGELGVSNHVEFTGYIEDKDRLLEQYRKGDIFVLPSLGEGFPRVLNEAMALGLPIIATKVGGIPAVMEDQETALLIEPEDPDAIVDSVYRLLNDDDLRNKLVENGYERAEWYFEGNVSTQHISVIEAHLDK